MRVCKKFVSFILSIVISLGVVGHTSAQSTNKTGDEPYDIGATDIAAKKSQWWSDLYNAYQEALNKSKPLVVYFYVRGGANCERLDREVLATNQINGLAEKAVFARTDAETDDKSRNVSNMQSQLGIKENEYPTVVVLDVSKDSLKERGRVVGFHPLDKFHPFFTNLLEKASVNEVSKR